MKVLVKDLLPNPFRTERYPFDEDKIRQLEANIRSTSFWDNILARQRNNRFEIAYGHHRLKALQNLNIQEVDIPVKELSDQQMLKIMAQENMEEWKLSPIVTAETVKSTYKYLLSKQMIDHRTGEMANIIAKFLSWPTRRVEEALANLRGMGEIEIVGFGKSRESPKIDYEAFEKLPTQKHASEFREAVRTTGASPKAQRIAAKIIAESADEIPASTVRLVIEKVQEQIGEVARKPKDEPKHLPDINKFVIKVMRDINKAYDNIAWISKNLGYLSRGNRNSFANAVRKLNKLLEYIIGNSKERTKENPE